MLNHDKACGLVVVCDPASLGLTKSNRAGALSGKRCRIASWTARLGDAVRAGIETDDRTRGAAREARRSGRCAGHIDRPVRGNGTPATVVHYLLEHSELRDEVVVRHGA